MLAQLLDPIDNAEEASIPPVTLNDFAVEQEGGGDVAASEGPASDEAATDPAARHDSEGNNTSPALMNTIARRRDYSPESDRAKLPQSFGLEQLAGDFACPL